MTINVALFLSFRTIAAQCLVRHTDMLGTILWQVICYYHYKTMLKCTGNQCFFFHGNQCFFYGNQYFFISNWLFLRLYKLLLLAFYTSINKDLKSRWYHISSAICEAYSVPSNPRHSKVNSFTRERTFTLLVLSL